MSAEDWKAEAKRAHANIPVLQKFADEKPAFLEGKAFTMPAKGQTHRVYTNLIGVLNMQQAYDALKYDDALRYYQQASRLQLNTQYQEALHRMKVYGGRIKNQ